MAASFKQEMEDLVPARITCASAIAPDERRKVSLPGVSGSWCGQRADVMASTFRLALFPGAVPSDREGRWPGCVGREVLPHPPRDAGVRVMCPG